METEEIDKQVDKVKKQIKSYKESKLSKFINKFLSYSYQEPEPTEPLTIKQKILKFLCGSSQ